MFTLVFGAVSGLFHKWDSACIDNHIFRLHYRGSVIILLAATALVTSGQFFGDPIDCMSDSSAAGIMDIYCWIHSTYSLNDRQNGTKGVDHVYPGLGEDDVNEDREGYTQHKYYQWVVFVLTLQAGMFYIPRLLWKTSEEGVMKLITSGLTGDDDFMNKNTRREGVELIAKYYHIPNSRRGTYFMKFFTCEILNFINVLGQIYFTDMFLGYQFTKYGRDVFSISEQDLNTRVDPLHKVFPKIAKCNFKFYGPSGTIQKADALCVLPLNIINEKIYIALYFWFIFLAAVSAVGLLYRLLTILSFDLRVSNIHLRSDRRVDKNLITLALAHPHHTMMERLGDYLLLYLITKNVNPLIIKDVFVKIAPRKYLGDQDELASLNQSSAATAPEL